MGRKPFYTILVLCLALLITFMYGVYEHQRRVIAEYDLSVVVQGKKAQAAQMKTLGLQLSQCQADLAGKKTIFERSHVPAR